VPERVTPEYLKELADRIEFAAVARVFPEPVSKIAQRVKFYAPYGGSYYGKGPTSIPAGKRVKLVDFKGSGRLVTLIMMVRMPDDTPPDVEFVVTIDGFEHEDWTIYEEYMLGLTFQAPMYGGYMKYDTTAREYSHYGYWDWTFAKSLKVEIANLTNVEVELVIWDVQFLSKI
jgi:hypothetical protein